MTERLEALLFDACARFGAAPALEDAQQRFSYAELSSAAQKVAESLRANGIEADEPVLVAISNAPQNIADFLGVWAVGGVVVPVSRDAPAAATEVTRAAAKARLMVRDGGVVRIGDQPPPERPLLKDAALIIFTSGSTGAPKGVVIGHDAFARKILEIDSNLDFSPATRSLLVLQITFIFGIWVTLLTLLKGGSVYMCPRFDAATLIDDLAAQRITDAAFVPTMLRKLLATEAALNSRLRDTLSLTRVHTGGEPFSPALGKRVGALFPTASITDIYGLTETASSDFFLATPKGADFPSGIGRISKSERFRIADAQGREVPPGEAGELQILTPFIMNGYLDQPELTRAAFADGYFRTGDMARLKADGTPELVGRGKDLIVRGGAKISPLELDGVLAQHPDIAAALTVGVADEIAGERIHVLVVPRAAPIDEKELRRWVAERVEAYKRPDVYHFGTELPLGRTGKVDRDALRQSLSKAR
jgi:acyl-CoA synthetase (AMP-forming)/AMP-acid ligase II